MSTGITFTDKQEAEEYRRSRAEEGILAKIERKEKLLVNEIPS